MRAVRSRNGAATAASPLPTPSCGEYRKTDKSFTEGNEGNEAGQSFPGTDLRLLRSLLLNGLTRADARSD